MKFFVWASTLVFATFTLGCGDSALTSSNAVCQAGLESAAVCDPDETLTEADIADCEAGNAGLTQECTDASVAMMNCRATNEACTDETLMSSCMTEIMAMSEACPDDGPPGGGDDSDDTDG